MLPAILGLSGLALTDAERALIRDADPAGFILFGRNVARQGAAAGADRLACATFPGRADLPILVDQEGGRVARLQAAGLARFPGAVAVRRALRQGADQRDRGGAGQCPGDRGRRSPKPGSTSIARPCSTCARRARTT